MKEYLELEKRFRRISKIQHAASILDWDEAVMMPMGSGEARAAAKAELAVIRHEILSDPRLGDLIEKAKSSNNLNEWQSSNLRLMERQYLSASCLPSELVERSSQAASKCEQAWRTQRKENNWKAHKALLDEVVKAEREVAEIKASVFKLKPYDSLLDQYEEGLKSEQVERILDELKQRLPTWVDQCIEIQKRKPAIPIQQKLAPSKQEQLGRKLMEYFGFDFNRGRLDISHHPFCGGVPQDIRLTTRYSEDDFISSIMGILHETGHACYEQNLPAEYLDQPVGNSLGMMIHESQSLLIEMQVCRSKNFLKFLRPLLVQIFKLNDKDPCWSLENLSALYSKVEKGFIRVDADEMTYPLHICLRFEIEKDLIEGKAQVSDIPEIWDTKMKNYLGLSTKDNYRDGCMQDIHWPAGLFGYFPCYTMGALVAAQTFEKIKSDIPEILNQIENGNMKELMKWLKLNIHSKGSLLRAPKLIEQATGKSLSSHAFLSHIQNRYLENT